MVVGGWVGGREGGKEGGRERGGAREGGRRAVASPARKRAAAGRGRGDPFFSPWRPSAMRMAASESSKGAESARAGAPGRGVD